MTLACTHCGARHEAEIGGTISKCCDKPSIRQVGTTGKATKRARKASKSEATPRPSSGSVSLVVAGAPRTKKNSLRRRKIGQLVKTIPSKAWCEWRDAALPKLAAECQTRMISWPVNCRALFFRDAERGDLVGYLQGLCDLLEEAGVLADDKWVKTTDGSRLLVDRLNPRTEVMLIWNE